MVTLKKIILALATAALMFHASHVQAKEVQTKDGVFTKMFLASNKILINPNGVSIHTPNKIYGSINHFISTDDEAKTEQERSWPITAKCGHQLLHWRCGGCETKGCQHRCRCWEIR